jgi:hypothetical protein
MPQLISPATFTRLQTKGHTHPSANIPLLDDAAGTTTTNATHLNAATTAFSRCTHAAVA